MLKRPARSQNGWKNTNDGEVRDFRLVLSIFSHELFLDSRWPGAQVEDSKGHFSNSVIVKRNEATAHNVIFILEESQNCL